MSAKKIGRPTDDPKPHSLHVRVNNEELEIIDAHCKENNQTRAEAVRDAIRKLPEKK